MSMSGLLALLIEMKVMDDLTALVIEFGKVSMILPQLILIWYLNGLIRIEVSPLKQLHIRTLLASGGTVENAEMNIRLSYIPELKDVSAHFA